MKKIIKLTEQDLKNIVRKIIFEQNYQQIKPIPQTTSDYLGKGGQFEKSLPVNNKLRIEPYESCVPTKIIPFVWWVHNKQKEIMSKLGIDLNTLKILTKASIGIFGRETSFGSGRRYDVKSFLDDIDFNTDLFVGSHGPAQMTTATYKETNVEKLFGMKSGDLYKVKGAGSAVLIYLNTSYKKALQNGYTTEKSSNINGTGNSALDMAIGSYNAGQEKITKYCKTNVPNVAKPCGTPSDNKFQVSNQPLVNYIPNFNSERVDTGKLTTHGYIQEVANYMRNYGCVDSI